MEREILARAIPLALGDALTQAVVLGGWKKAGLSHEKFASVLSKLPEGERALPTSTAPYIAGRILTTNALINELVAWQKSRALPTKSPHHDSTQSPRKDNDTTQKTMKSPRSPLPKLQKEKPKLDSDEDYSPIPPSHTQKRQVSPSEERPSAEVPPPISKERLRRSAYKNPSFYTSDNFPLNAGSMGDSVTRPAGRIVVISDDDYDLNEER